ncbi:MAG: methyl-accepting chemotaxis protein [Deltaproteobacteria bacterium]|nr:methyl-accepting chemotaxis protein [Deltaproteobacteria bacterium]
MDLKENYNMAGVLKERQDVNIKVPVGYKFILGFIVVVAAAAFVPSLVDLLDVAEWMKQTLSFLVAILIGLILGSVFTRSFSRHINRLTSMAQRISKGDLAVASNLASTDTGFIRDEVADLEEAVSMMAVSLRALVEQLKSTVTNLAEAQESFSSVVSRGHETSKEVISGTSAIFDGALEQANHIGDVSTTVKNMTELADEVANKVTESANASQKVNSMVQRGTTTATSAMEKMETIFKGIENTEFAAIRLKDKLNDIPKILDVITHISRQTDLLALNATIEASKAGEHGRGFAMVAEEVRRFADNTNNSVQDVSFIVKELKVEVERVVSSASEGTSNLKGGRDDLRKIREILVDITNYTSEVAEKATLILALTHKQKEKVEKSVAIIEQVADIARENLSSTEKVESAVERHGAAINETMAASEKLSELSKELKTVAARFNL